MAWTCTGMSNIELIDNLRRAGIITSQRVYDAMKAIDRKEFLTSKCILIHNKCRRDFSAHFPYEDSPQGIGYNATISAPHMHAYALEKLQDFLNPGSVALDIGSGSGYLTACMANMVGPQGRVVGVDHIDGLVELSKRNMSKSHQEWMDSGQVKLVVADGRQGYASDGPYDCIHVGAAAEKTPTQLLEQLKAPGRLFIPVGVFSQSIIIYDKSSDGSITEHKWLDVRYVPLTNPPS